MSDSLKTTMKWLRKSPTPLLLSPKALELVLTKERMRCDRHHQYFSLIVIHLKDESSREYKGQLCLLAKLLHKRLRLTDEKGMLLKGGLGVMLPMTEMHGAQVVLNSIIRSAARHGLSFEAEVFTYSGRESGLVAEDVVDPSPDSDSEILFDSESSSENTVVETSIPAHRNAVSTTVSQQKMSRVIRADDESQNRRVSAELVTTSAIATTHFCCRYPAWKRFMDISGALIGLAFALPFILMAAIVIKLTSKGPVFFRQLRTGQYGNVFAMYKLRTMVVDAEELKGKLQQLNERDGPAFKMTNDPRVTRLGCVLRKTGLDELPQLWNVLVGDMAIVGPRPLPCNEDAQCKVWQRRRLDTKPGLTCLWQISKSRKVSFSDWMRMDLRYADKRTIAGDVSLMFKTVLAVLLGRVGH
jgi:lipopolysaccharide/colanic/teichoic acid biosynthesis glycosyltransferase